VNGLPARATQRRGKPEREAVEAIITYLKLATTKVKAVVQDHEQRNLAAKAEAVCIIRRF
jgi:hypothetical protein